MRDKILRRIKALENQKVLEIEDVSDYEREIFGCVGGTCDEGNKRNTAETERA